MGPTASQAHVSAGEGAGTDRWGQDGVRVETTRGQGVLCKTLARLTGGPKGARVDAEKRCRGVLAKQRPRYCFSSSRRGRIGARQRGVGIRSGDVLVRAGGASQCG